MSSAGPRRTYVSLENEICGKMFAESLAFIPSPLILSAPPAFFSYSSCSAFVVRWAKTYVSLEDVIYGKTFAVSLAFIPSPLIRSGPAPFSSSYSTSAGVVRWAKTYVRVSGGRDYGKMFAVSLIKRQL